MPRWEYRWVDCGEDNMTELGEEGWEAVGFNVHHYENRDGYEMSDTTVLMKRQLPKEGKS